MDKATALEEGGLPMNAASVVLVAFPNMNDAALGGMSEGEGGAVHLLPFQGNCCYLFFMFCKFTFSRQCLCYFHPCN